MFAEIVFSQMTQMTQIFSLRTLSTSDNNLRDQRHLREINNKRLPARENNWLQRGIKIPRSGEAAGEIIISDK
jgi:hypothetical protein